MDLRTIDQSADGKLHDKNGKKSWALLEDLALYDNESWNDPRDFAKPVKAISLPEDVSCTSDRRIIELEHQVQLLMEAYIARMQPTQVNKITSLCEICSGPHDTRYCMENLEQAFVKYASSRIDEAGVLPARSYPTEDPHCSTQIHDSINTIAIHQSNPHKDKPKEEEQEEKDDLENINTNPSPPPDPSVSFIIEKKDDDSHIEEPEVGQTQDTIEVPLLNEEHEDCLFWRRNNGSLIAFSTHDAWNSIREHGTDVACDVDLNLLRCALCKAQPDSHEHLFFECSYSAKVWVKVLQVADIQFNSSRLSDILAWLLPISKQNNVLSIMSRMVLAAVSYFIWQERNNRIHGKGERNHELLVNNIVDVIRLKLASLRFKKKASVDKMRSTWKIANIISDGG
ncbi:hypothetical protein Tco_0502842 [Tanacetum coccineum]